MEARRLVLKPVVRIPLERAVIVQYIPPLPPPGKPGVESESLGEPDMQFVGQRDWFLIHRATVGR